MWTCFVRRCVQISISNKFTAVWDCPSLRCRCVCRFLYTYSTFEWLYFRYERHQKQKKEKEENKKQHNNHTHIYIEAAAASRFLAGCWLRIYFIWMKICTLLCPTNILFAIVCLFQRVLVRVRARVCMNVCVQLWIYRKFLYNMIFYGVCLLLVVMVIHTCTMLKFCLVAVVSSLYMLPSQMPWYARDYVYRCLSAVVCLSLAHFFFRFFECMRHTAHK